MQLAYQPKDYPKAIEYGNRALEVSARTPDVAIYVGNAYYIDQRLSRTRNA